MYICIYVYMYICIHKIICVWFRVMMFVPVHICIYIHTEDELSMGVHMIFQDLQVFVLLRCQTIKWMGMAQTWATNGPTELDLRHYASIPNFTVRHIDKKDIDLQSSPTLCHLPFNLAIFYGTVVTIVYIIRNWNTIPISEIEVCMKIRSLESWNSYPFLKYPWKIGINIPNK